MDAASYFRTLITKALARAAKNDDRSRIGRAGIQIYFR
jgi:hypothetical protein